MINQLGVFVLKIYFFCQIIIHFQFAHEPHTSRGFLLFFCKTSASTSFNKPWKTTKAIENNHYTTPPKKKAPTLHQNRKSPELEGLQSVCLLSLFGKSCALQLWWGLQTRGVWFRSFLGLWKWKLLCCVKRTVENDVPKLKNSPTFGWLRACWRKSRSSYRSSISVATWRVLRKPNIQLGWILPERPYKWVLLINSYCNSSSHTLDSQLQFGWFSANLINNFLHMTLELMYFVAFFLSIWWVQSLFFMFNPSEGRSLF